MLVLRPGFFNSPCAHRQGLERARRGVPPRARGAAEPRRKGRIGRGAWDGAGRAALEAPLGAFRGCGDSTAPLPPRPSSVGSQPHGTPTRRRPRCGSSLWSSEVFSGGCAQPSGARSPRSWPRALFPANLNHTQWQMLLCNWLSHLRGPF